MMSGGVTSASCLATTLRMGRTAVNVTGTMVAATLTAKKEGELDETRFYQDKSKMEVLQDF